jgi:hypothetical protein
MPRSRDALTPSRQTARALPFPLAPLPAETTVSYLRRLAAANTVPLTAIINQIGHGPSQRIPAQRDLALNPSAWTRLGVMTGRSPAALISALRPAATSARRAVAPLPPRLTITTPRGRQIAAACHHCLARRGILDGQVKIWLDPVTHLCHRHRTWLRDRQFDISILPELVRAQHRHNRLAARHEPEHLAAAWTTARDIIEGWRRSPFHPMAVRFRTRHDLLTAHHHLSSLPLDAASYPESVHLTALIADPDWHAASRGNRDDHERFLREANPRLNTEDLHHADVDDPLLTWLRIKAGYQGAIIADPRSSSPLLKSPPLHLSGWTQPTRTRNPRHRARMSRRHMAQLRARPKTDEPKTS